MQLSDLLAGLTGDVEPGISDAHWDTDGIEITGITSDSRLVRPGFVFVAIPGTRIDGRTFIPSALAAGAAAILVPAEGWVCGPSGRPIQNGRPAPIIPVPNLRRALARLAATLHPGQPDVIAAITGTNGKTSVACFTRDLWAALGRRSVSIGTLGVSAAGFADFPALTTPDPIALHAGLHRLASAGYSHLAIEASSHGLDQHRLDGLRVRAAGFTNLTRDHLDYHGTMDAYRAAKLRLFEGLVAQGGIAVANADSGEFEAIRRIAHVRDLHLIDYGRKAERLRLTGTEPHAAGQRMTGQIDGVDFQVDLPLVGSFQAGNVLCALGLAAGTEPEWRDAVAACLDALPSLRGVRGRMERVGMRANGGAVYVDYAHTPDALDTALSAIRPHVGGRLIVVFGCGGDRDPGKRPLMGESVERLADIGILTDDNPRTEDPAEIRRQTLVGAPHAREIGDRRAAIFEGVRMLGPGDVLLVAGKGHETGQTIGTDVLPFDDAAVAREALTAVGDAVVITGS